MKNIKENLQMSSCKAILKDTKIEVVKGKSGTYFRSGKKKKLDLPATEICRILLDKEK